MKAAKGRYVGGWGSIRVYIYVYMYMYIRVLYRYRLI